MELSEMGGAEEVPDGEAGVGPSEGLNEPDKHVAFADGAQEVRGGGRLAGPEKNDQHVVGFSRRALL